MKRTLSIIAVLLTAVLLVASCATKAQPAPVDRAAAVPKIERQIPGGFPDFVKAKILEQPEDALVGIGVAQAATMNQAMQLSETRARVAISRQIETIIKNMFTDYTASSEVDPTAALSFNESITVALTNTTLTGARVADQDVDPSGQVWTVMMLDKASAVAEITQAQAAAKLAVPAMAAFNAESRMDAAIANYNNTEAQAVDE